MQQTIIARTAQKTLSEAEKSLKLTVNGEEHTVVAAPDMPLLYALRDDLNLNGPKFGCGLGQCGACTVHLDGKPIRSCITPVANAAAGPYLRQDRLGASRPCWFCGWPPSHRSL